MKRMLFLLAVAALVLPATAVGKGPSRAEVSGPGDGGGISFTGNGESGGTPLGNLTEQAGFFPAAFAQQPNPMLTSRPEGELGPKYTITYTVPGPTEIDTLRQDVDPYAKSGPVTYMEPGQKFFGTEQTRGGWYQAPALLKETLIEAGLPKLAPSGSASDGGTAFFTAELLGALAAAALLLGAATVIFLRRRERPAAAA